VFPRLTFHIRPCYHSYSFTTIKDVAHVSICRDRSLYTELLKSSKTSRMPPPIDGNFDFASPPPPPTDENCDFATPTDENFRFCHPLRNLRKVLRPPPPPQKIFAYLISVFIAFSGCSRQDASVDIHFSSSDFF